MAANIRGASLRGIKISTVSGPTIPDALGGFFELYDLFRIDTGSPQNVAVEDPHPNGLFWDVVSGSPTLTGTALSLPTGSEIRTQVINCDNSGGGSYTVFEVNYTASASDSVLVLQSIIGTTTFTMSIYGTTASGLQGKIQLVVSDPNWVTPTYTVTTTGVVDYSVNQVGMVVGGLLAEILVDGIPVAWQYLPDIALNNFGNGVFSIAATGGSATYTVDDAKNYLLDDWTKVGNAPYTINESFTGPAGPAGGRYIANASESTYWKPNGNMVGTFNGSGGYLADLSNAANIPWLEFNVRNVAYVNGFAIQTSYTDVNQESESSMVYSIDNTQVSLTITGQNMVDTGPGTIYVQISNNVDVPIILSSEPLTAPNSVDYRNADVRLEFQQSGVIVKVNNTPITMYYGGTNTVFTGAVPITIQVSGTFVSFLLRPDVGVAGSDTTTINYVQIDAL